MLILIKVVETKNLDLITWGVRRIEIT